MKKNIIIITIIFMAIALAIPAGAQMYGRGMSKGMGNWSGKRSAAWDRIHEIRSNLTTEQRDEIRKMRDSFLDETVELRDEIREKSVEFRDLLKSENPNKREVMSLRKKIMDLRTTLFEKKFDLRQEQRKIIDADNAEG